MHTSSNPNVALLWVVLPIFLVSFVGIWVLVVIILSYVSGWASLAKWYEFPGAFEGEIWNWQSGTMRSTNFNSCLKIGASVRGLYLAVIAPLRFRNPALFIPWDEVAVSRRKRFLMEVVRLELGRELKIPFWIRPNLAERLQHAAGGRWPIESVG